MERKKASLNTYPSRNQIMERKKASLNTYPSRNQISDRRRDMVFI